MTLLPAVVAVAIWSGPTLQVPFERDAADAASAGTIDSINAPDLVALASAEFTFAPGNPDATEVSGLAAAAMSLPVAMQSQPANATTETAAHRKYEFFQHGSWRWQLTGALASDFNEVSLGLGGVAFSYFIEDDLTVDFEFNGLYINQTGRASNTGAVSVAMLFRWHFWLDKPESGANDRYDPRWSMYADGGIGLLYAGSDVPLNGSQFNFTPQLGIGVSLLLNEASDTRLLTGVRWYHMSNANIFDSNDGVDSLMVYAGINFPF